MKNFIMKIAPCVICCLLVICACGKAATVPLAADKAAEAADALNELGLFNGTGTDEKGEPIYELERTPNRHEAVTMLVRLLGKEVVAEASSWMAPFTDVADWAKPYVGYAYKNGITLGTSNTTYGGSADTTATQYITFMLRTLGYSSETEFKWDAAWELSDKIGMTNGEYNESTTTFTRGDMAIISYSALSCEMKNGMTLYDYLVKEGVITDKEALLDTGEIKTPYLTLHFDDALSDHLNIVRKSGAPYTLEFYAALDDKPEQRVFDILIGNGADGNLGIIKTNLGEVPVSVVMHSFIPGKGWTQDEINTVFAIQEVSNDLINQLTEHQVKAPYKAPEPSVDKPETNTPSNTEITTPFCTLHYPEEWKDYLQVEQKEAENHSVMFYAALDGKKPVLLFTLIFGGDFGEQLGAIKNNSGEYVPVNVVIESLENINYSEAEMTIFYEMQEEVNVLIAQLPLE